MAETIHARETVTGFNLSTLATFAALVVVVAANAVAIRFSNRELPPFFGAAVRFAVAGALFSIYVAVRHIRLPCGRALARTMAYGLLQFGIGFALMYWAMLRAPAGLVSVLLASVPLFTYLFAFLVRLEPFRVRGLLGALIALGGITAVFWDGTGNSVPLPNLLAAVGTAVCFALALVVAKVGPEIHLAAANAVGMLVGAAVLIALSWISGEVVAIPVLPATWIALLHLTVPGSVGGFGLMLFLLNRLPASVVSYQAVLTPIVAIALSAWLLGESLSWGLAVGAVLVIAGVYIGALMVERRVPPA